MPITRQEMHDMMRSTIGNLKTFIETPLQAITLRSQVATSPSTTDALENGVQDNIHYVTWQWGGRFHPVPQDFKHFFFFNIIFLASRYPGKLRMLRIFLSPIIVLYSRKWPPAFF